MCLAHTADIITMKKFFALTLIFALVFTQAVIFGGCSLFGSEQADASTTEPESSTEAFSESTTDFSEPDTMTTEEITTIATTTRPMPTVEATTAKPDETTADTTKESATAAPTTAAPTTAAEKTTAPAKASSNLNSIISTLNSGSYTMSIGVTDDKEDKVTKYASGGSTAYSFYIPDANFNCRVFKQDGKYYMVTTQNYCELTKEQYNHLTSLMSGCFGFNFSGLTFKDTGVEFYNSQLHVKESFSDSDGSNINLWFRNGALKYIQQGDDMISASVSSGANGAMFTLPEGFAQADYESLSQFVMTLEMFLSA